MKHNGTPSFFDTITDKIIKDDNKSENYGVKTDSSFNGGSVKETAAEKSDKIIDIFSNTKLNEMNEGCNNSMLNQKESIPFSKLSSLFIQNLIYVNLQYFSYIVVYSDKINGFPIVYMVIWTSCTKYSVCLNKCKTRNF
jgi:hypothetical protein